MSSGIQITRFPRTPTAILVLTSAIMLVFATIAADADAGKRAKRSAASKKAPVVTRVDPKEPKVGDKLTISGRNFVTGRNKMRVIFQRDGSKRRFTMRGTAKDSKTLTVIVPDVTADLLTNLTPGLDGGLVAAPIPSIYRLRLINKYGIGPQTRVGRSPKIGPREGGADSSAAGDCDLDNVANETDTDDDNDLLTDTEEATIGTDPCAGDSDGDGPSDYYEFRVALEWNGGPVLAYPKLAPFPNPLMPDGLKDFDGDGLLQSEEYMAWRFTGRMDRFYSDANQDSDGDGVFDDEEDEDGDLMMNWVELRLFISPYPLDFVNTDTDGDGLCDGLDDQDHDGPPTAVAAGDCSTPVPNNGPGDTPAGSGAGDPGPLIDGDDSIYSNWYEWYSSVSGGEWYDPCQPSVYPTSPMCPHLPPHNG